jgi:arsenate reductase (thioredoxin)
VVEPIYNVLFLCTGNAARSIIAEAILNRAGAGRFHAYSAGSKPRGEINPHTLTLLGGLGHDTAGFRSKSWDEFAAGGAPEMDFVFTVCDDAAGETCPIWPGHPATAHWGIPDPSKATGTPAEIQLAFDEAYRLLANRIGVFVALPIDKLDHAALRHHLHQIGAMSREPSAA